MTRKQPEFVALANETAQSALEDMEKQHKDLYSADRIHLWALLVPKFVQEFPPILDRLWLIGSVAIFEVYLRKVIVAVLSHKPGLIEQKYRENKAPLHKQMAQLEKFYQKLDFLESKLQIVFKDKDFTRDQLEEIQRRRNLFVHHDGIVDESYVKWVKNTSYKEGDEIDVSDEYRAKSGKCLAQATIHVQMSLLKKFVRK